MPGLRARVVVKARIVKLGGKGMAAAAHLRYLQRDGTTREGERGALYPGEDHADGKAFLERGQGDLPLIVGLRLPMMPSGALDARACWTSR